MNIDTRILPTASKLNLAIYKMNKTMIKFTLELQDRLNIIKLMNVYKIGIEKELS